jgi:hypothetical protein
MIETLFAHGCSVTHGSDLVSKGQDPLNSLNAYPGLIAKELGLRSINKAVPGTSNEFIFNSVLETIYSENNPMILVGWTTLVREAWKNDDSVFTFNINYGSENFKSGKQDSYYYDSKNNVGSFREENLHDMAEYLKFFSKHKIDENQYRSKLYHYSKVINDLCEHKNITLIETCFDGELDCLNLSTIGNWIAEGRHPVVEEHKMIADLVLSKYKDHLN